VTSYKYTRCLISLLTCSLLCGAPRAWGVEHPGLVEKDCSSCHIEKIRGQSVHSAMSSPCTVCHVTMTQDDMTVMSLSMPKTKICSACHDESAALRQHLPPVNGLCVECHDAHSSRQGMLLLEGVRRTVSSVKVR
jgi:predicted CXXCH cytochrome family protein